MLPTTINETDTFRFASSSVFNQHIFFFHPSPLTVVYPLSLHDALPIFCGGVSAREAEFLGGGEYVNSKSRRLFSSDRKSTRLNSSHRCTSYAVFCLKKKNGTRSR